MLTALEALDRLRAGNQRFLEGTSHLDISGNEPMQRVKHLVEAQSPFAVVLGCSDSRVPVELIFDQGLGDLFVIRVAGNVAAPSQIGSIEYATTTFGTRLVVVLGHSRCGAVLATVDNSDDPDALESEYLGAIVRRVMPSVRAAAESGANLDRERLVEASVRANVRASARHLREDSDVLARLIARDGLLVVGAEYALETGRVDFFDGLPGS